MIPFALRNHPEAAADTVGRALLSPSGKRSSCIRFGDPETVDRRHDRFAFVRVVLAHRTEAVRAIGARGSAILECGHLTLEGGLGDDSRSIRAQKLFELEISIHKLDPL